MKLQQRIIITQLRQEQTDLETDVDLANLQQLIRNSDSVHVQTGIPEDARVLTCPYRDLKTAVLNKFELLDKRYETHLNYLRLKYQSVLE